MLVRPTVEHYPGPDPSLARPFRPSPCLPELRRRHGVVFVELGVAGESERFTLNPHVVEAQQDLLARRVEALDELAPLLEIGLDQTVEFLVQSPEREKARLEPARRARHRVGRLLDQLTLEGGEVPPQRRKSGELGVSGSIPRITGDVLRDLLHSAQHLARQISTRKTLPEGAAALESPVRRRSRGLSVAASVCRRCSPAERVKNVLGSTRSAPLPSCPFSDFAHASH